MDLAIFDPTELVAVARALHTVACVDGVFAEAEVDLIDGIVALHGGALDPRALTSIEPAELAQIVVDPHKRKRAVQLLIVMRLVEEEHGPMADELLREFSEKLGIEERAFALLNELAAGNLLLARFDLLRRIRPILFRGDYVRSLTSAAVAALLGEDRKTAERYRALATYPEGTLGRVLHDGWRAHGFAIPGEKGGLPERGVFHDVGHVLSGYDVDPAGEIRQAAFQAGFIRQDGFAFFLFALLQFHLGIRITPIAKSERGYFEAGSVLRAAQRGAACKVDLSDPNDWDFWSVADVPVSELRVRYGVPEL